MTDNETRHPTGLTRRLLALLQKNKDEAADATPRELLARAEAHLASVREAHAENSMVNLGMAGAIYSVFQRLVAGWDDLQAEGRPWLLGAMSYFASVDDEEPDLVTPVGFEDDCDVLNACLRFVERYELCLNPEDYEEF